MAEGKHLYRSNDAKIAGVCAGIAEYLAVSPLVIRAIAVVLTVLCAGAPIIAYLILTVCVPRRPADYTQYVDVAPVRFVTGKVSAIGAGQDNGSPCPRDPRVERGVHPCVEGQRAGEGEAQGGSAVSDAPGACYAAAYCASYDTMESSTQAAQRHHLKWLALLAAILLAATGIAKVVGLFIPGVAWWGLWPVAVIVYGVVQLIGPRTRPWDLHRLASGAVTIGVGLLLLACLLGWVGWGAIYSILALWPLLVIALGMLFVTYSSRSVGTHLCASALCLGAIAIGCVNYVAGDSFLIAPLGADAGLASVANVSSDVLGTEEAESSYEKKLDIGAYHDVSLDLRAGASKVRLRGCDDQSVVVGGTQELLDATALALTSGSAVTNIKVKAGAANRKPVAGLSDIALPDQARWKYITVEAYGCDINADLSNVSANNICIEDGACSCDLTIGQPLTSTSRVTVDSAVSGVSLFVPEDVEALVDVEGRGTNSSIGGLGWDEQRQAWVTSGYDQAKDEGRPTWNISLSGGLTSYRVRLVQADE